MDKYTAKPFSRALGELLQDKYGDAMGRYVLSDFLDEMAEKTGKGQEYIRLMLRGKRPLILPLIPEAAAQVLGVSPHYFVEYRRHWIEAQMRQHPEFMDRVYEMARALFPADKSTSKSQHSSAPLPLFAIGLLSSPGSPCTHPGLRLPPNTSLPTRHLSR